MAITSFVATFENTQNSMRHVPENQSHQLSPRYEPQALQYSLLDEKFRTGLQDISGIDSARGF
jgi:hypothetical protein